MKSKFGTLKSTGHMVRCLALVLFLMAFSGTFLFAGVVTYSGEDLNAGPGDPHPLSSAAASSFDAAAGLLGTASTITFESAPVGSFSSLSVASGVTMTGADYQGNDQQILNTPNFPSYPYLDGFNTTPGGTNYVEVEGGTLTFTFADPTQFFGAYFTGVQTAFYADNITFSDGTSQTIYLPGTGTDCCDGALDFVGFTDAGKSISSVTITASDANGADFIGVDDVQYQSGPAATPEPSTLMLLGSGMLGVLGLIRKRRVG